jgi:peptide/nickel transport system substrate-binding protein
VRSVTIAARADGRRLGMSRTRYAGITALLVACALGSATLTATVASARAEPVETQPKHGGSATFGLEAETTGGFCLPFATIASSGNQVVNAIYDTLVVLNTKGEYVPYLAESVTANADSTQWTITLRPDVQFHDGTPFDAAALKLNLDTDRGLNSSYPPGLGTFALQDIATVDVTGPRSVVVTTKVPWIAFPAYLTLPMAAPAQLADPGTCATNMIGTGPFELDEWRPNESLTVKRNPDYWRKGFPYLDEIVFRPITDDQARLNGLTSGDLALMTTSISKTIADLKDEAANGDINLVVSDKGAEVAYLLLNTSRAPFDDLTARRAVAAAADPREINEIRNQGLNAIATGPFPPDHPAYVANKNPRHDLKLAKRLARVYEAEHGQPISFEYLANPDPEQVAIATLIKEQQAKAGIDVSIRLADQSAVIQEILGGRFESVGSRGFPGGDPDTQYFWWHSGSPLNFGRFSDPEIDRLLDEARSEPDQATRVELYQDLNRRFAEQVYDLWSWYSLWAVASQTDVKGVAGPPLPDGGGRQFVLFGGLVPVLGLSRT